MLDTRDDVYRDFPSTAPTRYETLSAAQSLATLERALHTLLTPFEYPGAAAWLDAAWAAMSDVMGTDVRMPKIGAGGSGWDVIERKLDAIAETANRVNAAASPEEMQRAAMARVLVPPFKAGVSEWRRLAARRSELAALLDAIPEAVLMYDGSGGLVHANPRAAELFGMPGSSGPGAQVRTEAQRIAWALAASAHRSNAAARATGSASETFREVRADGRVYRLRGTLATGWMPGDEAGVLVTAAFEMVNPLTDIELRSRYGLSAREIEVARLVANGLSNQEVAEKLGVSYFTARNHVERLLAKLGVGNRSRVGAVLRNEAAA